jgi:hypothetical protein
VDDADDVAFLQRLEAEADAAVIAARHHSPTGTEHGSCSSQGSPADGTKAAQMYSMADLPRCNSSSLMSSYTALNTNTIINANITGPPSLKRARSCPAPSMWQDTQLTQQEPLLLPPYGPGQAGDRPKHRAAEGACRHEAGHQQSEHEAPQGASGRDLVALTAQVLGGKSANNVSSRPWWLPALLPAGRAGGSCQRGGSDCLTSHVCTQRRAHTMTTCQECTCNCTVVGSTPRTEGARQGLKTMLHAMCCQHWHLRGSQ